MPCRDPRDDVRWSDVERVEEKWEGYYNEVSTKLDSLTAMVCSVFTEMDKKGETSHLENPESRIWWEDHKKADIERLEREKQFKHVAMQSVYSSVEQMAKYKELLEDERIAEADKAYFADRISSIVQELKEFEDRYPGIMKEVWDV